MDTQFLLQFFCMAFLAHPTPTPPKKAGKFFQLPALDNQVDQVSGMVNIQDAMDAESMQLLGPVEFAGRNSMLGMKDQQDSLQ